MRRVLLLSTFGAALLLLSTPAAIAHGVRRRRDVYDTRPAARLLGPVSPLDGDEALTRECVAAEVRVGDARVAPENVRVSSRTAARPASARIRVTTRSAIDEPVVTIDLTVGCSSQMSRRFVAFVDPPTLHLAQCAAASLRPQRVDSQVAPLLDIVVRGDAPAERAAAQRVAGADAKSAAGASTRRGAFARRLAGATVERGAAPAVRVAAPRAGRGESRARATVAALHAGPRLRLDTALPVVPTPAAAPASAAAAPRGFQGCRCRQHGSQPSRRSRRCGRAKPRRRRWRSERARIESLEAGARATARRIAGAAADARGVAGAPAPGRGRSLRATGWSIRSLPESCSSRCSRPRSGRCGRASAGARAGSTRRRASRSAPPAAPVAACEADDADAAPAISQHPSGWAESGAQHPAGDGAGDDRRPRSDDRARAAVALRAHGARAKRRRMRPLPSAGATSSPMEELHRPRAAGGVLCRPRPGRGGDRAADRAPARERRGSPLPFLQLLEIHQRLGDRGAYERAA